MSVLGRRGFMVGAVGSGAALVGSAGVAGGNPKVPGVDGDPGSVLVDPGDARYGALSRGANQRWVGSPKHIRLARCTADVVAAVQDAVRSSARLSVRSGGHCFESFVDDRTVRVLIDLSGMKRIYYDRRRSAFAVEPGAVLGEVYEQLFKGWGVTIPAGTCLPVGIGGHIAGGGYGVLNRSLGLTVDYLDAVEVVTVDAIGAVRAVVATSDTADPHRDLWWAHTGGGGGNFGVVTRYWFRLPDAVPAPEPSSVLPKPPSEVLISTVRWPYDALTESSFSRILSNYSQWLAANNAVDSPTNHLYSQLQPFHRAGGGLLLNTQLSAQAANCEQLWSDFHAAVSHGVDVPYHVVERRRLPWLTSIHWNGFADSVTTWRFTGHSGYQKAPFTRQQTAAIYRHITRTDFTNPAAGIVIASYGGKVNTVSPVATAQPHRDSHAILLYIAAWNDAGQDAQNVGWLRELYRDVYADTGGVPVPNDVTDGCYVNYPNTDLNTPTWNTSGVPWHTLYYKDNYSHLQQAKQRWDPRNIFQHNQSVQSPPRS